MKTRFLILLLFIFLILIPTLLLLGGGIYLIDRQTLITDPTLVCLLFLATGFLSPYFGFSSYYIYTLAVRFRPALHRRPLSYSHTIRETTKVARGITDEIKLSKISLKNARHLFILLQHSASRIDFPGLYLICWFVQEKEKLGFFDILRRFLEARRDTEFQGIVYRSRRTWQNINRVVIPVYLVLGLIGVWKIYLPLIVFPTFVLLFLSLFTKLFFWPIWVKKAHYAVSTLRDANRNPTQRSMDLIEAGFKLW